MERLREQLQQAIIKIDQITGNIDNPNLIDTNGKTEEYEDFTTEDIEEVNVDEDDNYGDGSNISYTEDNSYSGEDEDQLECEDEIINEDS